jgi:hypothetical protein
LAPLVADSGQIAAFDPVLPSIKHTPDAAPPSCCSPWIPLRAVDESA